MFILKRTKIHLFTAEVLKLKLLQRKGVWVCLCGPNVLKSLSGYNSASPVNKHNLPNTFTAHQAAWECSTLVGLLIDGISELYTIIKELHTRGI